MSIWHKVMVSLIALGCMIISWYLLLKWMLPVHFPELYSERRSGLQSRSYQEIIKNQTSLEFRTQNYKEVKAKKTTWWSSLNKNKKSKNQIKKNNSLLNLERDISFNSVNPHDDVAQNSGKRRGSISSEGDLEEGKVGMREEKRGEGGEEAAVDKFRRSTMSSIHSHRSSRVFFSDPERKEGGQEDNVASPLSLSSANSSNSGGRRSDHSFDYGSRGHRQKSCISASSDLSRKSESSISSPVQRGKSKTGSGCFEYDNFLLDGARETTYTQEGVVRGKGNISFCMESPRNSPPFHTATGATASAGAGIRGDDSDKDRDRESSYEVKKKQLHKFRIGNVATSKRHHGGGGGGVGRAKGADEKNREDML